MHLWGLPPGALSQDAVERAATVLQPEQDASGQSRKTTAREMLKTAYMSEISRQGSTYPESFDLTYKEGVAGSTPASPTRRIRFSPRSRQLRRVWWLVLSEGVGGPQAGREVGCPERFL